MSGIVKPPFGTPLNRAHWAAQGLVASYLFNENSGRTVYDSSGNENHGTMIGFGAEDTPTSGWCAGPHGGAIVKTLNGEKTTASGRPSLSSISVVAGITLSGSSYGHIVSRYGASGQQYALYATINNLKFYVNSGSESSAVSFGSTAPLAQYHIIAGTFNGQTKQQCVYLNGVGASRTYNVSLINPAADDVIGGSAFAVDNFTAGVYNFVHRYSRALSPEEIAYLSAFPYCMYEQDDAIFSNTVPAKMSHMRRMVA